MLFSIFLHYLLSFNELPHQSEESECSRLSDCWFKNMIFFFIHFFPFEGCTSLKLKDPECCRRKKNWKFSLDFSPILIKMLYQSQLLEDFYFVSLWSECSWRATQCTELFSLTSLLKICLISDQLLYIYISKRSIFLFNILGWFL